MNATSSVASSTVMCGADTICSALVNMSWPGALVAAAHIIALAWIVVTGIKHS